MLAHFLAQTPTPIPESWQSGLISFGLYALLAVNVWDKLKRKPPLEETFESKTSARENHDRLEREIRALDDRTDKKIAALDARRENSEKEARDLIYREIGGLKQFLSDRIGENRESNEKQFGAIFGKLDTFQVSMQGLSNDVMHQIGKIEGRLENRKAA